VLFSILKISLVFDPVRVVKNQVAVVEAFSHCTWTRVVFSAFSFVFIVVEIPLVSNQTISRKQSPKSLPLSTLLPPLKCELNPINIFKNFCNISFVINHALQLILTPLPSYSLTICF